MTPEQIADLERLEREATPGEWGVLLAPESHGRWSEIYADGPQRVAVLSRANAAANGACITAARNALPSLLSSARDLASLRARVEELAGEWEQDAATFRRCRDDMAAKGHFSTSFDGAWGTSRAHAAALRALLSAPSSPPASTVEGDGGDAKETT